MYFRCSYQSHENVYRLSLLDQHDFPARNNTAVSNAVSQKAERDDDIETAVSGANPAALELQVQEEEIAELRAIIEQLKAVSCGFFATVAYRVRGLCGLNRIKYNDFLGVETLSFEM